MEIKKYLAHIAEEREQSVNEHLNGTAELCAKFAESFGCADQGRVLGLTHDIGKCSDGFQQRLRGGHIVDHASAGAIECGKKDYLWALNCIAGHHGGLADEGVMNTANENSDNMWGRLKRHLNDEYECDFDIPNVDNPPQWGKSNLDDTYVTRMLYSCLVDADYLDTEKFMKNGNTERGNYETPDVLYRRLERYIAPWMSSSTVLNNIRTDILRSCIDAGNRPRGLFTLTVPTGGGKTVSSLAFALKHAISNGMDRVIYVVPYTSIIEQNAKEFRKILGDANVLEHHSHVSAGIYEGKSALQYAQALATENWDVPVVVTTAVQFFESFYANRSSACRKLHNIANSVIIFDEAQMIPIHHLDPCVAAMTKLVELFRSSVVLCTATQPALGDLIAKHSSGIIVKELCPGAMTAFEKLKRVNYKIEGRMTADDLAERLTKEKQVLCIVNNKKEARELFGLLPDEGRFHLSTNMCPDHRSAVLDKIRCRLKNGEICRVVSTSLIEAGVDVDFPRVYRELAGLDSIIQAAGRCNREGKRLPEESIVTVFESEFKAPEYVKTVIGATRESLQNGNDPSDPETSALYFKAFRSLFGSGIDKSNVLGKLGCPEKKFASAAKDFHLIDNDTKTVYIKRGDGKELCQRLLDGEYSKDLFRKLNSYSVNVYENEFTVLYDSGALTKVGDDCAVLEDTEKYDEEIGLVFESDGAILM